VLDFDAMPYRVPDPERTAEIAAARLEEEADVAWQIKAIKNRFHDFSPRVPGGRTRLALIAAISTVFVPYAFACLAGATDVSGSRSSALARAAIASAFGGGGVAIGFAVFALREPGRIPLGNVFASIVAILVGLFAMLCSLIAALAAIDVLR
jgi:hypothetical protein